MLKSYAGEIPIDTSMGTQIYADYYRGVSESASICVPSLGFEESFRSEKGRMRCAP
jgi:hypothetical protein